MGLFHIHTLHYRALCDGCKAASKVFCFDVGQPPGGGQQGRYEAIAQLVADGWRHCVPASEPARTRAHCDEQGAGEWYCAACAASRART